MVSNEEVFCLFNIFSVVLTCQVSQLLAFVSSSVLMLYADSDFNASRKKL